VSDVSLHGLLSRLRQELAVDLIVTCSIMQTGMSAHVRSQTRENFERGIAERLDRMHGALSAAEMVGEADAELARLRGDIALLADRLRRIVRARGLTLSQKRELTPEFHGLRSVKAQRAIEIVSEFNELAASSRADAAARTQSLLDQFTLTLHVPAAS
jgi:hypothetical protein